MRSRASLVALLAALLMAGCTSDAPAPTSETASSSIAPVTATETQDLGFGGSAVDTPAGGLQGHANFDVPAGTTRLQADVEWSCVSLCPLHVLLYAPGGDVAAEADGGTGLTLEVQGPASGGWDLVWRARDGASVEPSGTAHLTFESLK
jgi:hypothetical protein